ncbi:hypothetical protein [Streptomyces sp. NPDC059631]|uniref:hypothetical protein n=1 Tax=unclassified Streptomyces TaxID=2593676 RepID=UPI003689D580
MTQVWWEDAMVPQTEWSGLSSSSAVPTDQALDSLSTPFNDLRLSTQVAGHLLRFVAEVEEFVGERAAPNPQKLLRIG